jgi:hypothetical protein
MIDITNWPYQGTEAQTRGVAMAFLYLVGMFYGCIERPVVRRMHDWWIVHAIRKELMKKRLHQ